MRGVFSGREQESPEAKVRWFRTLTDEERFAYACEMADFILENQPDLARRRPVNTVTGHYKILELPVRNPAQIHSEPEASREYSEE